MIKILENKTVLVVDDDTPVRDFIEGFLGSQATQVTIACAGNGNEAIDWMKSTVPDLVILDLYMPVVDGYGVIDWMRHEPRTSDTPILVMTGFDDHQVEFDVLEAGADVFLSKPVESRQFCARVNALLRSKERHDRVAARLMLYKKAVKVFEKRLCSEIGDEATQRLFHDLLPDRTQYGD